LNPEREAEFSLRLRIPDWCPSAACAINGRPVGIDAVDKGYLVLRRRWKAGDRVELDLEMTPRVLRADLRIPELAGKLAVQRGPLVYCAESVDNGEALHDLILDPLAKPRAEFDPSLMGGGVRIEVEGYRENIAGAKSGREVGLPYEDAAKRFLAPATIRLVPYHQWGNRAPGGEMRVWLRGKE
jgi:hypothetical protein